MLRRFIIRLMKITLDVSIFSSVLLLGALLIWLLKQNTDHIVIAIYLIIAAIGLVSVFGLLSLFIEINENLIAIRRMASDRTVTPHLTTGSRVEPTLQWPATGNSP
jgi:hypothetical protein